MCKAGGACGSWELHVLRVSPPTHLGTKLGSTWHLWGCFVALWGCFVANSCFWGSVWGAWRESEKHAEVEKETVQVRKERA